MEAKYTMITMEASLPRSGLKLISIPQWSSWEDFRREQMKTAHPSNIHINPHIAQEGDIQAFPHTNHKIKSINKINTE
jgi:hypothetical protein